MRRAPFLRALRISFSPRHSSPRSNPVLLSDLHIRRHQSIASSPSLHPSETSSSTDMPRLNPISQVTCLVAFGNELWAAIDRLRAFKPPPTSYDLVPVSRRAAVLLLLYADARGDLRVVLTIRASTLSSYAGQAALPGGKSDSESETPLQTARREAHEEIGLPGLDYPLPPPFTVEHLCEIPSSLARTELVVRPCVALLHTFDEASGRDADPETELIPRLDAREVAAVFTAPFRDFLFQLGTRSESGDGKGDEEWYHGLWTEWWGTQWRMHQFFVPIDQSKVIKPRVHDQSQSQAVHKLEEQESSGEVTRYRVFGMTARILVDAARIAYNHEPDFEHNRHTGDEDLIKRLRGRGRLGPKI